MLERIQKKMIIMVNHSVVSYNPKQENQIKIYSLEMFSSICWWSSWLSVQDKRVLYLKLYEVG